MGYTETDTLYLNNAIEKYPIIWALHSADMMASHFMESQSGNLQAYADTQAGQSAGAYADNPTSDAGAEEPVFEEAAPL